MAGHYKFSMDQKDILRSLIAAVGSFIQDRLINKEQRLLHKEQCAERLAAEDGSCCRDSEVGYSDQAVLANLDWGIDALEEAINTSNVETKLARLDYAEKMLQVCAMLNSRQKTAGVPNFYLSAWSHLYLAFLWNLRNNVRNSVLHVLEMFIIDPFFSRIDFAPELWKTMFLPHMSSIIGWYSESRHRLVMEVIPDSADLSFTADFDQFFNESIILSMRPDQAEKLQTLEQLYGRSLDEYTKLYAKYYKDCMNSDTTPSKRMAPMLPIAEPPMTPLHEVSRSIPDYVKFGPILPKSAGFSPFLKEKEECRLNTTLSTLEELEDKWSPKDHSLEENDCDYGSEDGELDMDSEVKTIAVLPNNLRIDDIGTRTKVMKSKNEWTHSSPLFSPISSPKTPSKFSTPSPSLNSKSDPEPLLRLLSSRITNVTISTPVPGTPLLLHDACISPAGSDGELREVKKSYIKGSSFGRNTSFGNHTQKYENRSVIKTHISDVLQVQFLNFSAEGCQSSNSIPSSGKLTPLNRPPKDFVCPITGQLLTDPVTLETGQTYERKAIQEWLKRGNTTCPNTRQPLSANALPKTNYVLKRLITSWKDQYPDIAQEFSYSDTPRVSISSTSSRDPQVESSPSMTYSRPIRETVDQCIKKKNNRYLHAAVSTSPTSVISQAAAEEIINGIKPYTLCLCTSEDLQECENAVLKIATTWKDSKGDSGLHSYLSKPTIVNGFAEILVASVNREVLMKSIYILSDLLIADETVGETLTSVDSYFDCLTVLLKNGLTEAVVLIYQLRPAYSQLSVRDLIPSLVQVILNKTEDLDDFQFVMDPKDAAVALLEQLLIGGDEGSRSLTAQSVISANGLSYLIKCLNRFEGRRSIVSILLCCMRADRNSRSFIANHVQLAPVLELFHACDDTVRGICIDFFSELVSLNRRTFCNQILQIIKDEGGFSTMHTFLVYLQMAPMEQQPAIASLLLQLDLLVEPRKMSIYREEAIETLIEVLRRKDFPISQLMALDELASVSGRLTASGKSLIEARLLQTAGLDQSYKAFMKTERLVQNNDSLETTDEEEKAAQTWENRVAFVLCNHENGSIFKALEECLKSNSLKMAKSCLVIATWLTHMLSSLPDTGVRDMARHCLLEQFINVLQSSRNLEEKALASVALRSFIGDKAALKELGVYAKSVCKSLRKLKRSSVLVTDILKALMNLSSINAIELWSCAEVTEIDSGSNGEVLSLVHLKDRVFSSHSDGTIKVWDAGKRVLRLIQEAREHAKSVTCLSVPPSGDKLYSGSLDKTIRIWAIKSEEIHCIQVHDVKEAVHELTANNSFACFASQATGVKIYNWSGVPKHVTFNKYVKCLAMTDRKLYCGCTGYSIQEVDLSKCTSSTFFSGTKKLLGKQIIHALCIRDGFLFAGGSLVDGIAGRVFSLSTGAVNGALPAGHDIHCIAVNNDFVFTGSKCGTIDVCLRERLVRVGSLRISGAGNTRVTSLISDLDGDMLFAGSSDSKIKAWTLD
ncbi:hypothetical protein AQUCO_00600175v1 [Aquilegia coerulea]|uniref:RING-type E3 ubiquitin transferase n=1 Tax=Aquilegia coerulea TaxID=218851 RepID=A0A2G5ENB5_AQUCA|nr:hypothetical protein AQUCO_00600175v1 [Aquilegia coerulea]